MARLFNYKYFLGFLGLLAVGGIVLYFSGYHFLLPGYHRFLYTPKKYSAAKTNIQAQRKKMLETLKTEKDKTLHLAGRQFHSQLTENLCPFWYGTRWGYNGLSETPGRGAIACGYFVTTLLRDMGCKIERQRLACLASEEMIKNLVLPEQITRMPNYSTTKFKNKMLALGEGLYVIGLDKHTGFISVKNGKIRFIHSSGRAPYCVLNQNALTSTTIQDSKYKVVGKLTADRDFLTQWLAAGQ